MSNPTGEGHKVAQGTSHFAHANRGISEELAADRNRLAFFLNLILEMRVGKYLTGLFVANFFYGASGSLFRKPSFALASLFVI